MPASTSSTTSVVLSSTPQNPSPDNEHSRFLERVLSAVGESIPTTPVTPFPPKNETTIVTPRLSSESQYPGKRTSIPVSDLLNSETPHNESEKENSKAGMAFARGLPRFAPFKLLTRNRMDSTQIWKPRNPATGEVVCLFPLTPNTLATENKGPFSSACDIPRMTTSATTAAQLPPLVLETLSSSNKRDMDDKNEKDISSSESQKPQTRKKRAMDDGTSVLRSKKKRRRGPKTLKCTETGCNILFNQPSAVRNHVRTVHHGERRFFCPEPGCNTRFGASGDVTRHVSSVHEGNRNSICNICGLRMSRNTVLYRHIRNIHGQEPDIRAIRRGARLKDKAS